MIFFDVVAGNELVLCKDNSHHGEKYVSEIKLVRAVKNEFSDTQWLLLKPLFNFSCRSTGIDKET